MSLTPARKLAFFTGPNQMAIPAATVPSLQAEGINAVADLAEFHKDDITAIAKNFRSTAGGGAPIVFGAKSLKRLIVAADMVRYYNATGRPLTAANMQWIPTGKNFEIQWKALKQLKDDDEPDAPKISKALPIMKWDTAFIDSCGRCIGLRNVPFTYLLRVDAAVPAASDLMAHPGGGLYPHSEEAGSIQEELINRASHDHPLFREDNKKLYYKLEEATRTKAYAASIKPFQRPHDGRGAYFSLISQHAGHDKWNIEVTKAVAYMHSTKWKSTCNYLLASFCNRHRQAHEDLKAAVAAGVHHQLPSEFTRVGYLLANIETSDPELQAAMAQVKSDKDDATQTGMRYNFEETVTTLTPCDPVAKRRGSKRGNDGATISDLQVGSADGDSKLRTGIGKTGVPLRWHNDAEYQPLSSAQKSELYRWRNKKEEYAGRKDTPADQKYNDASVSSAVDRKVKAKLKKLKNKQKADQGAQDNLKATIKACIAELGKETPSKAVRFTDAENAVIQAMVLKLNSILAKAKKG